MRTWWKGMGCLCALAVAPAAMAHELECVKTVNGETFLEVDKFPATLTYRLAVRNIHPSAPSDVMGASDPMLERLGFEGFDTPFTLPLGGEAEKTFDVELEDLNQCLDVARQDGMPDSTIDNIFTVRWDNGSDICSARVECVAPVPVPSGKRMTGGGSVFGEGSQRVTHGFQLRCDASDPRQNLQVNWGGNRFHLVDLTHAECKDTELEEAPPVAGFDTFIATGVGRYNGVPGATIELIFTDDGEPGVDDTARMVIRDVSGNVVLEVEGALRFGNHQAHGGNES